ncbi:MAG TPA: hypothetical protein VGE93_23350 [Bryobacteraceae bacterium]
MSRFVFWFLSDVQKRSRNQCFFDFNDPELDARVQRNVARIFAGDYTDEENGLESCHEIAPGLLLAGGSRFDMISRAPHLLRPGIGGGRYKHAQVLRRNQS